MQQVIILIEKNADQSKKAFHWLKKAPTKAKKPPNYGKCSCRDSGKAFMIGGPLWCLAMSSHINDGTQKIREKKTWFLGMVKISITFFALPEMKPKPKQCYKMIVPTSYCKKQALLQNDSPSKTRLLQNDMVQCYKMQLSFFQMPLKPGHGSPHFTTETCTGIHIIKYPKHSRTISLIVLACPFAFCRVTADPVLQSFYG